MVITTDYKRAWLGKIYRGTNVATLLGRLEAESDKRVEATMSGGTLVGTSANGHSAAFARPTEGGTSFGEMAALCAEMIRRHDEARQALIDAGTASPTDAQIYAEMLAQLIAVTDYGSDYTSLREPINSPA